jgi:hypothetical protein
MDLVMRIMALIIYRSPPQAASGLKTRSDMKRGGCGVFEGLSSLI